MVALENGKMLAGNARTAIDALKAARTVVIKVGSALLVDEQNNAINHTWLTGISEDIAALKS